MDYRWLAVPAILLIALGIALFLNQPKIVPLDDVEYVNVNGDEYLADDYITNDEVGIGDEFAKDLNVDYEFPTTVGECMGKGADEKDRCLVLYAVLNEDGSGCSEITDPNTRDDCFLKAAYVNKNESFCDTIKFDKQGCYVDVAIAKGDAALCEKGKINSEMCEKAVDAKDFLLCPEGQDRSHCTDAVFYGDKSYCSQLTKQDAYCYYNVAVQTNNSSLCAKAGAVSSTCYFKIATTINNASICENLSETRDNCVAWVALNSRNRELCYQAGAEAESCLEDFDSGE